MQKPSLSPSHYLLISGHTLAKSQKPVLYSIKYVKASSIIGNWGGAIKTEMPEE